MRLLTFIYIFPLFIYAQIQNNKKNLNLKTTFILSCDVGMKKYYGNTFLNQYKFSREGIYFNLNIFHENEISENTKFVKKASLNFNNAFYKKLSISNSFNDIDIQEYNTRIPNIFSCDININLELNKKINTNFSHSLSLKFRAWPLFYKKGALLSGELNSLGGLISSEENGSFPGLEKSSRILYSLNYLVNNLNQIKLLLFLNSDLGINTIDNNTLYPGFGIQFEKFIILNQK